MPVFGAKFPNNLDQHQSKVTKKPGTYSSNSCSSAASSTSSSNDSAHSCIVVNENRLKTVDPNHLKNFDLAGGFKFKSSALSASHGTLNGGQKSPSNRLFSSQNNNHHHHHQTSMTSLSTANKPPKPDKSNEMFTNVVIDLKNNPFGSKGSKKPMFFDNATSSRHQSTRAHSPMPMSHAQKCVDSLLHSTSKDGRISKRKNKKNANSMLLQVSAPQLLLNC